MKGLIKKILRENLLTEVPQDIYELIKTKYPNSRVMMDLRKEPFTTFKPVAQDNKWGSKPLGLWYSFGTEWIDWVKSEMPQWERDEVYLLDVNEANILSINSGSEIEAFNEQFSDEFGDKVDWIKVSKYYDGIEIVPYLYQYRYKYMWYYGWDVASGCIWGNGGINSIKKIKI